eukprot:3899207-Rhodomonas_salina.2
MHYYHNYHHHHHHPHSPSSPLTPPVLPLSSSAATRTPICIFNHREREEVSEVEAHRMGVREGARGRERGGSEGRQREREREREEGEGRGRGSCLLYTSDAADDM